MKKRELLMLIGILLLVVLASMYTGFALGSMMLCVAPLAVPVPGGGAVAAHGDGVDGVLTTSNGKGASSDLYLTDFDEKITRIRPNYTPLDNICRYAKKVSSESMEYKYYSLGTRPIKTTLSEAVVAQTSGLTCSINPLDGEMFDVDDTIRVVGVKGFSDGINQNSKDDLVLCVCGRDASNSNPVVFAVNGKLNAQGQNNYLPAIPAGTVLIRMGKACAELSAQTSKFANLPTSTVVVCQNFMAQVEQSTFDKMSKKEVKYDLSDLEEDSLFDMKLGQEMSFWFGAQNIKAHPLKKSDKVWFTAGIWNMAGKDIEVGKYDAVKKEVVIMDDELVDISKLIFTGIGAGGSLKVCLAGSEFLAAMSKIKSDKFRLKDTVEMWNLKFKSFDTDFGEILLIHHPQFNECGMSDSAFVLDPEYITKVEHMSFSRSVIDLSKIGVSESKAVVLREASGVYLKCPNAHARLRLVKAV